VAFRLFDGFKNQQSIPGGQFVSACHSSDKVASFRVVSYDDIAVQPEALPRPKRVPE
jgi:hypothetical protein